MKRLLALFLVLLLTGCAAPAKPDPAPQSTPPAAELPASPPANAPAPSPAEPMTAEAITPESLRAEYEAAGFTVREIVFYEGDFLVHYGTEPYNSIFQWIYTDTGLHAPLLFSGREVLDYEISYAGCIRVLEGGNNIYNNAAQTFPVYERAFASLPISPDGAASTNLHASGIVQQETYWAPLDISHTFGWGHGEIALVDLRITAQGIDAVFGPTAANLMGFFTAASGIPITVPIYDEDSHILTLRFQNTSLTSGVRTEFADENDRQIYEDLSSTCQLPTSFLAGPISGTNAFISSAEVQQDGEDTLLILRLTEAARQYTAETGQLLQNESRPFLRLSLREERQY